MGNRLAAEPSLYLRQHAENPVDWYPWGDEAFDKARAENKPVLVSIGYSSCHWCHVMERESFEDPETAAVQNRLFVSIKVDREERPDVDRVYMTACQLLTRQGGWPLNVFLLPDGRPFYAGTYFPPEPRYGRPSWKQLLEALHEAFTTRGDEVAESAAELVDAMRRHEEGDVEAQTPDEADIERAREALMERRDTRFGGFGTAPKFPSVMAVEHILRHWEREDCDESLQHVALTLLSMAEGGIYDQLGGGFARYSTDEGWVVPHFEKMLYDNGLLLRLYADAYRYLRRERLARVMRESADWLRREMTDDAGAFFATLDADSEGEEGKFYVWRPEEFDAVLGQEDGELARWYFGVTRAGNFEDTGASVLTARHTVEDLAERAGWAPEDAEDWLRGVRAELLAIREERERPGTDDKRITSWNALAIQGLARAGFVLGESDLTEQAHRAAVVLADRMWDGNTLYRIYSAAPGEAPRARIPGFLEDYALASLACVDVFNATGDVRQAELAVELARQIGARFHDPKTHSLFQVEQGGEELVVAARSAIDNATPSDVGAAVLALVRAAILSGDMALDSLASRVIASHGADVAQAPSACTTLLRAVDCAVFGLRMVIVADTPHTDKSAIRRECAEFLHADEILVFASEVESSSPTWLRRQVEGKETIGGATTFYVCDRSGCRAPSRDLRAALAG